MQFTPLAQAAMNFEYWRGTISFRFDVTASNFTRGKLLFIYEPNGTESFIDRTDRSTILNQQYMVTMDLEKERSITIHIGFNHHKTFANVYKGTSFSTSGVQDYLNDVTSDALEAITVSNKLGQSTGILSVRNATTITGIEDVTNPLYIHTYTYSNDIELAEPRHMDQFSSAVSNVTAESSYEQGEPLNKVQMKDGHRVTVTGKELLINRTMPSNHDIYLAHFGEKIQSLRVLLKRDQAAFFLSLSGGTNTITHPLWPPYNSSIVPKSIPVAGELGYRNTFNLMRFCYLGMRGGIRYRVSGNSDQFVGPVYITYKLNQLFGPTTLTQDLAISDLVRPCAAGSIIQNPLHGGIEYELPYKQNHFFDSACEFKDNDALDRSVFTPGALLFYNTTAAVGKQLFCMSIAEDFNFMRFQGACFYIIQ
jgi:hypothetical protein